VYNNLFLTRFKKRAALKAALFLCQSFFLLCILFFVDIAEAEICIIPQHTERVSVSKVFDGDTFALKDGRHVRFIGINATETAHKNRPAQPLSGEAKAEVIQFIRQSGGIELAYGKERYDHYGRTLALIFNDKKQSLEEILLRKGLAFPIYFPPNLEMANCFHRIAAIARKDKLGIWGLQAYQPIDAEDTEKLKSGFQRIKGVVEKVDLYPRKSWWISLKGGVVLRIARKNQGYFNVQDLKSMLFKQVEVSGWLIYRKLNAKQVRRGYKHYIMSLRYPYALIQ
jgi:endonuclease YncB( thermonuclease family)